MNQPSTTPPDPNTNDSVEQTFQEEIPWNMRDHLSLPIRLTMAVFLLSVGIGYVSALVNLHMQESGPGNLLPDGNDLILAYHGSETVTQMERLLTASEVKPFNGQGSMRSAFTSRVGGKENLIRKKKEEIKEELNRLKAAREAEKDGTKRRQLSDQINLLTGDDAPAREVATDLDGERLALVFWLRSQREPANPKEPSGPRGDIKKSYEADAFELPTKANNLQISSKFVDTETRPGVRLVKIKSILEQRCVRCHQENIGGASSNYPLDTWADLEPYCLASDKKEGSILASSGGKSLQKLALSTHVHLLGFSVLYGMTGLIFAFTSYPGWFRLLVAPLALLAQIVDISFWWLARMEAPYGPMFAGLISASGGVVAIALLIQILFTLFNLFHATGKFILVLLLAAAAGLGYYGKVNIVDPYLAREKAQMQALETRGGG